MQTAAVCRVAECKAVQMDRVREQPDRIRMWLAFPIPTRHPDWQLRMPKEKVNILVSMGWDFDLSVGDRVKETCELVGLWRDTSAGLTCGSAWFNSYFVMSRSSWAGQSSCERSLHNNPAQHVGFYRDILGKRTSVKAESIDLQSWCQLQASKWTDDDFQQAVVKTAPGWSNCAGRAGKAGSTHWLLQPRHVLSTVKCLFNVLLLAAGPLVLWLLCGGIGRCGSHAGFGLAKGFSTSWSTTAAMAWCGWLCVLCVW